MIIGCGYMQKIIETNICKINYSESLQELAESTIKLLKTKIVEYQKVFNIQFDEQIVVNYFDDLEKFREFIYEIRGEKKIFTKICESDI